jgi:hypothetical protein
LRDGTHLWDNISTVIIPIYVASPITAVLPIPIKTGTGSDRAQIVSVLTSEKPVRRAMFAVAMRRKPFIRCGHFTTGFVRTRGPRMPAMIVCMKTIKPRI